MNLIVPYTEEMKPIVKEVLEGVYGLKPSYRYVGDGDESYWALMNALWVDQQDVVIVEHDVLPWPGAVEELDQCPFNWCSCSYQITLSKTGQKGYGIHHTMGCTKFSSRLMKELPDVWTGMQSRFWRNLDAQFYTQALAWGHLPHPHRPPVIHLNDYEKNERKKKS